MDKKKIILLGGALLLLLIIVITIIALLPNKKNTTTLELISGITLAKGETEDKRAIDPKDTFVITEPEIHAIVSINGLPANTEIEYQWASLADDSILKSEKRKITTPYTGISSASLVRGDKLDWDLGNYEFRVLVSGKINKKRAYRVISEAENEKNQVLSSIKTIDLTTEIDSFGKASKNPTTTFSRDDAQIFASIVYQKLPTETRFEARWMYKKENRLIDRYQKNIVGDGVFSFGIIAKEDSWLPVKKWPTGEYQLKIYLDGESFKDIDFVVK